MAHERRSFWPVITIIIALFCLIVSIPDSWKTRLPVLNSAIFNPGVRLGLDLAGGTQLDFRISEDEINARKASVEQKIAELKKQGAKSQDIITKQNELASIELQHQNLVEAIRTVLERRINSLGVSEATITPSYFGTEKHLLVECPGIIDVNRCIETVGKTIRLEFKEEYTGDTTEYVKKVRAKADEVYRAVSADSGKLQVFGQDLSNQLGVSFMDNRQLFVSNLPKGLEALANRTPADPVLRSETSIFTPVDAGGGKQEIREVKGIYLTKILKPKETVERPITDSIEILDTLKERTPGAVRTSGSSKEISTLPTALQAPVTSMDIGTEKAIVLGDGSAAIIYLTGRTEGKEEMKASHILIQYKGALRADPSVTRTKEEAKTLIASIMARLKKGERFETIAGKESDGESRKTAGSIGTLSRGIMPEAFDTVAFALKQGSTSDIVETPYGFHIIRADAVASFSPAKVSYELLTFKGDQASADALLKTAQEGKLTTKDEQITVRSIFFSLEPTGWRDTELNGEHFRSAAVGTDNYGRPIVQIQFDEDGGKLFFELTKRNVNKRIAIFVGGELVQAPNVNEPISSGSAQITGYANFEEAQKVSQDLNTGAIPAPIYLSGQSTVEPTLGAVALQQSINAAIIGLLILCVFMILIYRVFGVVADIALLLYIVLLVAATKLPLLLITNQHVVLTLAGIAGIILSMGMAVDANVLAFERVKEELRRGKSLRTAVDTGFHKAWASVRDGNVSTLITCAILFMIGTSIIRGFAVTLSIGIMISLFTGMVVSKWICRKIAASPLAHRSELFGVTIKKDSL